MSRKLTPGDIYSVGNSLVMVIRGDDHGKLMNVILDGLSPGCVGGIRDGELQSWLNKDGKLVCNLPNVLEKLRDVL